MIVAIVQARINSTRLPAKVLLDLAGKPVLVHVCERLKRARRINKILVATSELDRDEPIASLAAKLDIECFRGSEIDVLNRFYRAALSVAADVVVRITSDCPLIDPEVVDEAIRTMIESRPQPQYVVNDGYPRGFDVEVLTFQALERAWQDDHNPETREHVTAYITSHPDLFPAQRVICPEKLAHMRLTIDTLEDFQLLFKIFHQLGDAPFGWKTVANLLAKRPEWLKLNAHVRQHRITPPGNSRR